MTMKSQGPARSLPQRAAFSWQTAFALGLFLQFAGFLLAVVLPQRGSDLFNAYFRFFIFALAGALFARDGLPVRWEDRFFLAFLIWLLISRWFCGDFYLFIDQDILVKPLFCFLLFCMGSLLAPRQREQWLAAFSLLYCGFFFLACLLGIFVALTNTYIHIPTEVSWITILRGNIRGLNLFSTFRLTTAPRLFLAWSLLACQFLRAKKTFWRILLLIPLFVFHVCMSLCFSRSIQICFSLCVGLLCALIGLRRPRPDNRLVRAGFALLLFVFGFLLVFKSYTPIQHGMNTLRSLAAPRFEQAFLKSERMPDPDIFGIAYDPELYPEYFDSAAEEAGVSPKEADVSPVQDSAPSAQTGAPVSDESENPFTEKRAIAGNTTLTGRTGIWLSTIPTIREQPEILLYGHTAKGLMQVPNKYINSSEFKPTMHNMFLQTLMLTGVPGLLFVTAWVFLLARKMLRAYFGRADRIPFRIAFLAIPLACMLVFNLVESLLFSVTDLCSMVFFLLAGLFLAEYDERFPRREAAA